MTTSADQPNVRLFGLCYVAIFCFYSFPMVVFSWLIQSNRWLTITPVACHSFESEYGEFGENSQNSANFFPCNSYRHQISHLGLFNVGRNVVFSTQEMVMFSTIRYFAVNKALSFPHFTWPSRQHGVGSCDQHHPCITDEELTHRVKLLARNHTHKERQQPSDCRWYAFSTLSLPPTWLLSKVCRELVPICNGLPGGSQRAAGHCAQTMGSVHGYHQWGVPWAPDEALCGPVIWSHL